MKLRNHPTVVQYDPTPIGRLLYGRLIGDERPGLFMKAEYRTNGGPEYHDVSIAFLGDGEPRVPEMFNAGVLQIRGLLDLTETYELVPSSDFGDLSNDFDLQRVPGTIFISPEGLELVVRVPRGAAGQTVFLNLTSGLLSPRIRDSHVAVRKWSLVTEGADGKLATAYTFPPRAVAP